MSKTVIGITDCGKFNNYEKWIAAAGAHIEVIQLGYKQGNLSEIEKCTGVVLTGGEDVHPKFYNQPEYLPYCLPTDMDEQRDEFELQVLERSQQMQIPVLGICRGLQIANVFFGGTLVPDLPSFGKYNHSKFYEGKDRYHAVSVDPNALLHQITHQSKGYINSAHHQSAGMIGKDLVVTSLSDDGVVESIERKNPQAGSWLLLVQWHPERMRDKNTNPFSVNIRSAFLEAAKQ